MKKPGKFFLLTVVLPAAWFLFSCDSFLFTNPVDPSSPQFAGEAIDDDHDGYPDIAFAVYTAESDGMLTFFDTAGILPYLTTRINVSTTGIFKETDWQPYQSVIVFPVTPSASVCLDFILEFTDKRIMKYQYSVDVNSLGMGFRHLPGGYFIMGSQEEVNERPVREVYLDAFRISVCETTFANWRALLADAAALGYVFNYSYSATAGSQYPANGITFHDALLWCNALSEKEGKTPCYYLDNKHITVYRAGGINFESDCVDWAADGYRLPTEAEWEYACRAGTTTPYYFGETGEHAEDYCWFKDNSGSMTQPVGQKTANPFGLYDMPGNLDEWCWDWYFISYSNDLHNPHGGAKGTYRILRGGFVGSQMRYMRSSARLMWQPQSSTSASGFRVVYCDDK